MMVVKVLIKPYAKIASYFAHELHVLIMRLRYVVNPFFGRMTNVFMTLTELL